MYLNSFVYDISINHSLNSVAIINIRECLLCLWRMMQLWRFLLSHHCITTSSVRLLLRWIAYLFNFLDSLVASTVDRMFLLLIYHLGLLRCIIVQYRCWRALLYLWNLLLLWLVPFQYHIKKIIRYRIYMYLLIL